MTDVSRFDVFQDLGHTHALQTYAITQIYEEKMQGEEYVVNSNNAPVPAAHLDKLMADLADMMDEEFARPEEQGALGLTLRAAATGYWSDTYRNSLFEFLRHGLPEDLVLMDDEEDDNENATVSIVQDDG